MITAVMPFVLRGYVRAPPRATARKGEACVPLQPVQMPFGGEARQPAQPPAPPPSTAASRPMPDGISRRAMPAQGPRAALSPATVRLRDQLPLGDLRAPGRRAPAGPRRGRTVHGVDPRWARFAAQARSSFQTTSTSPFRRARKQPVESRPVVADAGGEVVVGVGFRRTLAGCATFRAQTPKRRISPPPANNPMTSRPTTGRPRPSTPTSMPAGGRAGGALSERGPGGGETDQEAADQAGRPGHDQAACGRGGPPTLDLLPHVPGDGDHGVPLERGNHRARPADRRARVAQRRRSSTTGRRTR